MSNRTLHPSPTGRLTRSEPEIQHFPGTPMALAQAKRMRKALENAGSPVFIEFDLAPLELKALDALVHPPAASR